MKTAFLFLCLIPTLVLSCTEKSALDAKLEGLQREVSRVKRQRDDAAKTCEQKQKSFEGKLKSLETLTKQNIRHLKHLFHGDKKRNIKPEPDTALKLLDQALRDWGFGI